jgi:hypothetical protein
MTRVGWLVDYDEGVGGAELTEAEFRAGKPDDVEIVACPPGAIKPDCDRYVIQNCVTYSLDDLLALEGKPVTKYWHDVGPWLQTGVRGWLDANATIICCSPLQAEHMGYEDAHLIPPAVNLGRFMDAADRVNGSRRGSVCVGSWRNHGKAPHRVAEWAAENGPVQFFGDGIFAPPGSRGVDYESMPGLLASFERLVFLPNVIEPFGRVVAEAYAAGCELVINGNVGAVYWLTERPEAIETAASDFWQVVLG